MPSDIQITVDDQDVRKLLKGMETQSPFALSLAINNVAKDAQTGIQSGFEKRFTLRRPAFIKREGAKITKFAKKADAQAIIAVTEKAGFLGKFEDGGTKSPQSGKAIAIPLNVRRNKSDIIPVSQRPPALYASKGAAAGRIFSKAGLLIQKVGRGARAVTRVLYVWKSSVRVPALLQFKATANEAVDKNWSKRAVEAVDRAISTAK
jgi:hypothetical protein